MTLFEVTTCLLISGLNNAVVSRQHKLNVNLLRSVFDYDSITVQRSTWYTSHVSTL